MSALIWAACLVALLTVIYGPIVLIAATLIAGIALGARWQRRATTRALGRWVR